MTDMPKTLFKYQTTDDENFLNNLKESQIYFKCPSEFNDPYDCAIWDESIDRSLDASNKFRIKIQKLIAKECDILEEDVSENEIEKYYPEFLDNLLKKIQDEHKVGCSCFSEKNDHILMWAHYSGGHTGFCLEFDTSSPPFVDRNKEPKVYRVNYEESFPKIKVDDLLCSSPEKKDEAYLKLLTTKYLDWKYEKEWRVFLGDVNKPHKYPVKALKAVYFGTKITEDNLKKICLILRRNNRNILFFKMKKIEGKFKLEPTKISSSNLEKMLNTNHSSL
ncbi:MAG: DUF2971 domain-containing protein [Legionellales bacterium]|nr:DUF2971 domain-containing protein [Legionellales bacterium]